MIRHLHFGNEVCAKESGERVGIHFVGLDFGMGDGLDLQRVRNHDMPHATRENVVERPGVEGRFEDNVVPWAKARSETLDRLSRGGDTKLPTLRAFCTQGTNLDELLVDIEAIEHASSPVESP